MFTAAQQHAIDQFTKSLLALSDDALIDTYMRLRMIVEPLEPRIATTSAMPTRRRSRPKRRCEIGSLTSEPGTSSGTREPARITIQ